MSNPSSDELLDQFVHSIRQLEKARESAGRATYRLHYERERAKGPAIRSGNKAAIEIAEKELREADLAVVSWERLIEGQRALILERMDWTVTNL